VRRLVARDVPRRRPSGRRRRTAADLPLAPLPVAAAPAPADNVVVMPTPEAWTRMPAGQQ
jgi:hypothetical protein